MPDIFKYLDFRQFLKDAFAQRKSLNPNFSYRYISQKAGIKSSGFLSMVISGKRNISERLILKLADILKLNKKEKNFFRSLVYFNQARTQDEKTHFYNEIIAINKKPVKTVQQDQYAFYNKWYHSAIRELVEIHQITDNDFTKLAKMVKPQIKPSEAKSALDLLNKLGMIFKSKSGIYKRANSVITSGKTLLPFQIHRFQVDTMKLAEKSIDHSPTEKRELSTITMSIDKNAFSIVKKKLSKLRSEIMELARSVKDPDQVYQLNLQFFPMSEEKKEHNK